MLSHISDTNKYCLRITDTNHYFFQLSTEQDVDISPSKRKGKPFIIPIFLLFLILILLLFSGIHLPNESKQKRNFSAEAIPVKQTNNPQPEVEPTTIGANFSNELDFADRDLSSLTEVIAECDNPSLLQTIYGENNQLKSVEELQLFPSLKELYLSNNQIQNTDSFQELNNLSVLILSDNPCTDLTGLSTLQQLSFLDLSGNRELSDITPLASCQNLNTLILSDTAVTEFSIKQLQAELPECQILY